MPAFDNSWSRTVFWLKIVLPLLALAILSTLFLLSRRTDPESFIPYAEVDVDELAREQRLGAAEVRGVTSDGAAVTIRADVARPGTGTAPATAENVTASYRKASGLSADVAAKAGTLSKDQGLLTLTGDVTATFANGTVVESAEMQAATRSTRVTSPGPVVVTAPEGRIDAGSMELAPDASGDDVLVFKDGVRLIYDPKARKN